MKSTLILTTLGLAFGASFIRSARAEEGGSGHYLPGAAASFIDAFHGKPGSFAALNLGGIIGVGANGFYYKQISGDSGSGATLGDFEGRTPGVGPVLSYVRMIGAHNLVAELKWLPELDTKRRLKGDYIWFKLALAF